MNVEMWQDAVGGNVYSYISFIHPILSQTTINNTSTVDSVQRPNLTLTDDVKILL